MEMPAPSRTSLIDAVNDRDEPIGKVARGKALETGASFRTTHVFVLNGEGDLLLQKLAAQRERHPGRWGSSVAAYLNSGESYEQGASRRLYEELGLILSLQPLGKLRMRDEHSLKFVSLYLGIDGDAVIRERDHIEEIAYWPQARVRSAIEAQPRQFTPTFRELYRAFGSDLP